MFCANCGESLRIKESVIIGMNAGLSISDSLRLIPMCSCRYQQLEDMVDNWTLGVKRFERIIYD